MATWNQPGYDSYSGCDIVVTARLATLNNSTKKLEEKVSKEALDRFYDLVKPVNGSRWYDKDPIISKTVEILRVVPPEVQNACAERFIAAIREKGIEYESPNHN